MYEIKTEAFEGPLSLLLQLIEQEKLDITNVSLANVADQYLAHIDKIGDAINTAELADFLVVASRLLVIKSRVLIPSLEIYDESEGDLEYQLKMYKAYKDASDNIKILISKGNFSFSRNPIKLAREVKFLPPKNFSAVQMPNIMKRVILRMEELFITLPKKSIKRIVSLADKISSLRDLLKKTEKMFFNDFIKSAKSRSEIVVSFLAMLELAKQRHLTAEQEDGSEIVILSKNQCL